MMPIRTGVVLTCPNGGCQTFQKVISVNVIALFTEEEQQCFIYPISRQDMTIISSWKSVCDAHCAYVKDFKGAAKRFMVMLLNPW